MRNSGLKKDDFFGVRELNFDILLKYFSNNERKLLGNIDWGKELMKKKHAMIIGAIAIVLIDIDFFLSGYTSFLVSID